MSTLLSRMFRSSCARCQVNQGRGCFCAEARQTLKPRRRKLSPSEWLCIILLVSVAISVGSGWLVAQMLLSWRPV